MLLESLCGMTTETPGRRQFLPNISQPTTKKTILFNPSIINNMHGMYMYYMYKKSMFYTKTISKRYYVINTTGIIHEI